MNAPYSAAFSDVQTEEKATPTITPTELRYMTVTASSLMANMKPAEYLVHNLLVKGMTYTLTARNNHGKTTLAMMIAGAVTRGHDFAGKKTRKGRVLWLSGENTHDTLYKVKGYAQLHQIDPEQIEILQTSLEPKEFEKFVEQQNKLIVLGISDYALVVVDSLQAYSGMEDTNTNAAMTAVITAIDVCKKLKGKPTLLVLAHPTKNATEQQLIPYGGGALMNYIDGNLTLWLDEDIAILHHTKLRQNPFEAMSFKLNRAYELDGLVDDFGIPTTTAYFSPVTAQDALTNLNTKEFHRRKLLEAINYCQGQTLDSLAEQTETPRGSVQSRLKKLQSEGYVTGTNLTPAGVKLVKEWDISPTRKPL
jgi:hypothetical protein